jgi:DNA polymerase I-like protein with 3'-5' exonuclease and polymerase domains
LSLQAGKDLATALFDQRAVTITGRIRGKLLSTQACNTPFQGLAADGGKLALFELVRRGYRVVGYIHDEVVVEVAAAEVARAQEEICRVLCDEMKKVLGADIPVETDSLVADRWGKP